MDTVNKPEIRNVAIIAHVDHGKTTLVDCLLRQSGIFRANEHVVERIMDSNELERERGITILSKNTAVVYQGVKINIIDTPGHADFSGEVERVLKMADGALLVVDAFEGPMPQTRFVLKKALEAGLTPIVVINKIDRPNARCAAVVDEVLDLFIELEADEDQLDFPVLYASAREGYAVRDLSEEPKDMRPLFETILARIPRPGGDIEAPLQLQVAALDYDDYVGRIAIGRITQGVVRAGETVAICRRDGTVEPVKASLIYLYHGLKRVEAELAVVGDIVALTGISGINIGETITSVDNPQPLPMLVIDEPTLTMAFSVNDSPFAGQEGKYVTSRHLRERLFKETETNVSLQVEETDSPDAFKVCGRGELHLSILIETMRREGYEFQVSKPEPIIKEINGRRSEPYEELVVTVPEEYLGPVMESLGERKAELTDMTRVSEQVRLKFRIPARGLIGFRSEFLTQTRGNGTMYHVFDGYGPYKGEIRGRTNGVLVASETGESTTYGLHNAQERGSLFIGPVERIYAGMIVGENPRGQDIPVNVCKKKHVTNMRSSTSEEALRLTTPRSLNLEEALEFINDDELVEVTPRSIRLRKFLLDGKERLRESKSREKPA
ncbi:MAG: translational GTPase TypA [Firmicutes bacterium]|nr:translational GTPase TypA [Bacillota bacterium]